jgi:hypothetical protein
MCVIKRIPRERKYHRAKGIYVGAVGMESYLHRKKNPIADPMTRTIETHTVEINRAKQL